MQITDEVVATIACQYANILTDMFGHPGDCRDDIDRSLYDECLTHCFQAAIEDALQEERRKLDTRHKRTGVAS